MNSENRSSIWYQLSIIVLCCTLIATSITHRFNKNKLENQIKLITNENLRNKKLYEHYISLYDDCKESWLETLVLCGQYQRQINSMILEDKYKNLTNFNVK